MIESVDSEKLAAEIDRQAKKQDKVMDILIEVNIGREENKSGICPKNCIRSSADCMITKICVCAGL